MSTSTLRLQNTIPFVSFSPSLAIMVLKRSRFFFGSDLRFSALKQITFWVIFSEVVACRATSTSFGFCKNSCVMREISGAIVALKKSVWRVNGVSLNIRSISGMKPISSIRSASSTTIISIPVSSNFPLSKWSSRRPGVAINTSTPLSIRRSCSLKETPPIRRAISNFTYFAYCSKFSAT